jgi:hypothetical protein
MPSPKAPLLAALLLALSLAPSAPADARVGAAGVAVRAVDGHTSSGEVSLGAPPAEVFAAATDFARWPALLADVEAAEVLAVRDGHTRVRYRSRALARTLTVDVTTEPSRAIRFALVDGPPGARARGEFLLAREGEDGTRVTATLRVEVTGAARWLVDPARVRAGRSTKLASDLASLRAAFPR